MKLKLTAAVEGVLELPVSSGTISAERSPLTFTLTSDANKRVTSASVTLVLTHEQAGQCKSLITHPPGSDRLDVEFPPAVYQEAVQQLQTLESNLSFEYRTAAVTRIHWDEPTIDLVPDSVDEEALINTWSIHVRRTYPEPPAIMHEQPFQSLILAAPRYDTLVVLKAFSREGKKEFRGRRYVQAFYNFYFVVEGMFAKGRFKKAAVIDAFRESKELRTATRVALDVFIKNPDQWSRLRGVLHGSGFTSDAEGLWGYLLQTRGELHHYSTGGSVRRGTPFSNDVFETPALIAMILANQCILVRILTINGGSLDS